MLRLAPIVGLASISRIRPAGLTHGGTPMQCVSFNAKVISAIVVTERLSLKASVAASIQ